MVTLSSDAQRLAYIQSLSPEQRKGITFIQESKKPSVEGVRSVDPTTGKLGGSFFKVDFPKGRFQTIPSTARIQASQERLEQKQFLKEKAEERGEVAPKSSSETWEQYIARGGKDIPRYIAKQKGIPTTPEITYKGKTYPVLGKDFVPSIFQRDIEKAKEAERQVDIARAAQLAEQRGITLPQPPAVSMAIREAERKAEDYIPTEDIIMEPPKPFIEYVDGKPQFRKLKYADVVRGIEAIEKKIPDVPIPSLIEKGVGKLEGISLKLKGKAERPKEKFDITAGLAAGAFVGTTAIKTVVKLPFALVDPKTWLGMLKPKTYTGIAKQFMGETELGKVEMITEIVTTMWVGGKLIKGTTNIIKAVSKSKTFTPSQKLTKIRNLYERAGTTGERTAARSAYKRLGGNVKELPKPQPTPTYTPTTKPPKTKLIPSKVGKELYTAGDLLPSKSLIEGGKIWGFETEALARGWMAKKGKQAVYKLKATDFVRDPAKAYARPILDITKPKGFKMITSTKPEYIIRGISGERLVDPKDLFKIRKKEAARRAGEQLIGEVKAGDIKLVPELPSKIRKEIRKGIIAKRSISPLDITPGGIFKDIKDIPPYQPPSYYKTVKREAAIRARERLVEDVTKGLIPFKDVRPSVRKIVRKKAAKEMKWWYEMRGKKRPSGLVFDVQKLPLAYWWEKKLTRPTLKELYPKKKLKKKPTERPPEYITPRGQILLLKPPKQVVKTIRRQMSKQQAQAAAESVSQPLATKRLFQQATQRYKQRQVSAQGQRADISKSMRDLRIAALLPSKEMARLSGLVGRKPKRKVISGVDIISEQIPKQEQERIQAQAKVSEQISGQAMGFPADVFPRQALQPALGQRPISKMISESILAPPKKPFLPLFKIDDFEPKKKKKKKRKVSELYSVYRPSLAGVELARETGKGISKPPEKVGLGLRPVTQKMIKDELDRNLAFLGKPRKRKKKGA